MTTSYVDYEYYTDTYLGVVIAEADFARMALRASAVIDSLTFGRAADDEDYEDEIQMAACAVAEVLYDSEQNGILDGVQSERVGDYAVTYASTAQKQKSLNQLIFEAASLYLSGTGLMYPGFYGDEYGALVSA